MATALEVTLRTLTDRAAQAYMGPATYLRACRLEQSGAVTNLEVGQTTASARVRDVRTSVAYTVAIELDHGGGFDDVRGRCTCGDAPRCAHRLAVCLALAHAARSAGVGWRDHLEALIDEDDDCDDLSLALDYTSTRDIALYPMRRDGRGAWTRARVAWTDLRSSWESVTGPLRASQVAALRGLSDLALERNRLGEITLASLGPHGYSQLAALHAAGIATIDATTHSPVAIETTSVRPVIDVREDEHGLHVEPALQRDDEICSLRGWIVGGRQSLWAFDTAAPALYPVSAALTGPRREWWVTPTPVRIPSRCSGDFTLALAPRLARCLPLVSTDRSWMPPVNSPVELRGLLVATDAGCTLRWRCLKGEVDVALEDYPHRDVRVLLHEAQGAYSGLEGLEPGEYVVDISAACWPHARLPFLLERVVPALNALERVSVEVADDVKARIVRERAHVHLGVSATSRRDWFDLEVQVQVGGYTLAVGDIVTALASDLPYVEVHPGVWVSVDSPKLRRFAQATRALGNLRDPASATTRVSSYHAHLWDELEEAADTSEVDAAWRERVGALAREAPEVELPAARGLSLRGYQVAGARWCHRIMAAELGGILADDMGLGKTVQVLTALVAQRRRHPASPPVLVVAPTSVASTWIHEAARLFPELRLTRRDATQARRGDTVGEQAAGCDLFVTTYHLLRLESDAYAECEWGGLILDEAQAVKNPTTLTHRAVRGIECPWRMAVTGTPLENSLMDLWSIFALVAPGLLPGKSAFTREFRTPIEVHSDSEVLQALRQRCRPFLCRRTKEQVAADLPDKSEHVLTVELAPEHRRCYDAYLTRERQRVLGLLDDLSTNRMTILRALTMLRLLSLDTALVDGADPTPSAKTEVLLDHLRELLAAGHSALVFSQFTSYLTRIRERLGAEGMSWAYLDGATRNRDEEIARFRCGDARVFLLSLKAGGVGLTLTEADYVFILDPWWNPAVEAQAVDRAHRIGQKRPVTVYRLLADDTIEAQVARLAEDKRRLYTDLIDAQAGAPALTAEAIRDLLRAP